MNKTEARAAQHEPLIIRHTFSDGSVIARCTASGCNWGRGHGDSNLYSGKHTDSPVEVEPVDFEESEPVEVLSLDEQFVPQAGEETVIEVEDAGTGLVTLVPSSQLQDTDENGDPESEHDSETGYREIM